MTSGTDDFNYREETKEFYQSDNTARKYHGSFTELRGVNALRFRLVAGRERAIVESFLRRTPHKRVLDIPAGTGKLAPVFATLGASVTACDISENMLAIAREEYERIGHGDVEFYVCDAEKVGERLDARFDVVVCLRLLHRVPSEVKELILENLAESAKYVVASFGVESRYHRVRRATRAALLGGSREGYCYEREGAIREKLDARFDVIATKHVVPLLSQEKIYLLRVDD